MSMGRSLLMGSALVGSLLCLAGCQPLRGSWYYQKERAGVPIPAACDHDNPSCLYLSVINDSNKRLEVDKLLVYAQPAPAFAFLDRRKEFWECQPKLAEDAYTLDAGQILVVALPHTGAGSCRIPQDASMIVGSDRRVVRISIARNNPNSIPDQWFNCPGRAEPASTSTTSQPSGAAQAEAEGEPDPETPDASEASSSGRSTGCRACRSNLLPSPVLDTHFECSLARGNSG